MTDKEKEEKLKKAFDIYESFQTDFEYTNRHTTSFAEAMWEIIENEKATYVNDEHNREIHARIRDRNNFTEATGLGPSTYDRIKSRADDYVPSIKTFMTLCMIYQLNVTVVRELRQSYGYDFNAKDKIHQAYVYLLVNCRGKSLFYCNKVLKSLGVEEKYYLGDGTIDEDWVRDEVLKET